ncbi:MAG: helix-turn-helix domain-containing protein [bacterium]|nr:helix-turn-helix domain-containing protein [bacterium]
MNQSTTRPEVLTLEDAAHYLRLPGETVAREAATGGIPARQIEGTWRFSQSALSAWLARRDDRAVLLRQEGALRDDDSLDELLEAIYKARGRPEVDGEGAEPCTSSTQTP